MSKLAIFVWQLLLLLIVAAVTVVIVSLPVLIAWNLGIVGAATALGLAVGKIGFWTALGLTLFIGCLRRLTRPHKELSPETKASLKRAFTSE